MAATVPRSGGPRPTTQSGSATVEVVGLLPWLFLAAFAAWQILLVAFSATAAENAARTGSRAEGLGMDGERAAEAALPSQLRRDTKIEVNGATTTITVEVPIIVPGLSTRALTITKHAELPEE